MTGVDGLISHENITAARRNYSEKHNHPLDCTWAVKVQKHERVSHECCLLTKRKGGMPWLADVMRNINAEADERIQLGKGTEGAVCY